MLPGKVDNWAQRPRCSERNSPSGQVGHAAVAPLDGIHAGPSSASAMANACCWGIAGQHKTTAGSGGKICWGCVPAVLLAPWNRSILRI